jgi:hypothetical protein
MRTLALVLLMLGVSAPADRPLTGVEACAAITLGLPWQATCQYSHSGMLNGMVYVVAIPEAVEHAEWAAVRVAQVASTTDRAVPGETIGVLVGVGQSQGFRVAMSKVRACQREWRDNPDPLKTDECVRAATEALDFKAWW